MIETSSRPAGRWRARADVSWCRHGGIVILYSLDSGRYSTLSGTAEQIWRALCEDGLPVDAVAPRVAEAAGTPDLGRVAQDVASFVAALERARLVEPGDPRQRVRVTPETAGSQVGPPRRARRRPTVLGSLVRLFVVQVLLKRAGLRRTVHLVAGAPSRRLGHRSEEEARQVAAAVRTAATLYPLRTACLEQSLCVLWMMRARGADARLRLGVAPFPLRAHAWVEHDGVPINEEAEVVATYRTLPDLLTS
jgi:hypothetical protein